MGEDTVSKEMVRRVTSIISKSRGASGRFVATSGDHIETSRRIAPKY
jgi:hypothetical protein